MERYRAFLPIDDDTPALTLGEGDTPLVHVPRLGALIGVPDLYCKIEGQNPTGSFKDRGMTVAVSMAVARGATAVICASTGNTSASAAAYAARAGLTCAVLVPRGKIALGQLAQALVHGAKLLQVDGNFDDCLELARKLASEYPVALVNSVNPDRLEGQKTAAFEIVEKAVAGSFVDVIPAHRDDDHADSDESHRAGAGLPCLGLEAVGVDVGDVVGNDIHVPFQRH